ncbi:MAG: D-alanyl-D-alanine carboxypeptidase [Abditibacteriota bacterium]|nr:D-alanyl-D-alanine carboxypeptidase [Abditibacteriota bacterium]
MRKYLLIALVLLSTVCFADIKGKYFTGEDYTATTLEPLTAASAIIEDAETGQILYGKNIHTPRQNASTTKMMTAILLIENTKPEDMITASENASETPFTSIYLQPGEKISSEDLLRAMMIRSANDTCVAAAEHISGNVADFVKLMNDKAKKLGCVDTHFVTPNGLYAPGHHSSVYDLCIIARYGMTLKRFNEVINMRSAVLESRTVNKDNMLVKSKSEFLKTYPGADGVKSGYIKQAGNCYVGSATRDGLRLVSAILKSENANAETAVLMDYIFTNYKRVHVATAGEVYDSVELPLCEELPITVKKDVNCVAKRSGAEVSAKTELTDKIKTPVKAGTKVGSLVVRVDGRQVAAEDLIAAEDSRYTAFWLFVIDFGKVAGTVIGLWLIAAIISGAKRRRERRVRYGRGFRADGFRSWEERT